MALPWLRFTLCGSTLLLAACSFDPAGNPMDAAAQDGASPDAHLIDAAPVPDGAPLDDGTLDGTLDGALDGDLPDVVVPIDEVAEKKLDMLDAHTSQFYEWMPWVDGKLESVPPPGPERRKWLAAQWLPSVPESWRARLAKEFGPAGAKVRYAEAFEISEYGSRPTEADVRRLFPFFGSSGARSE